MQNNIRNLSYLILLVMCLGACKRKANVGNGLVPDANNSNLLYTDTLTLITRTLAEDSLITSELSNNVLGTCNDPVFGESRANLFAQYLLPVDNFTFNGATKFDSAVLYLSYLSADKTEGNTSYGEIVSPQRFTVHEMLDPLDASRAYFHNSFINYDAAAIGSYYGTFKMNDSITITLGSNTQKIGPALRIKLDNNWAKTKIFQAPGSSFSTNTDFLNYLKGIAIISEGALNPGNGGFVYVNATQVNYLGNPTGAGLVIYYNDSLSVTFPVNKNNSGSSSRRVNTYFHVTTQTNLPRTYAYTGSLSNTDTCFIQAMGRYKMMIRIPYLYELAKKYNIAVNSAELILKPYSSSLSNDFYAPVSLRLLQPNAIDGRNDFIRDIFYTGSTPLNPNYGGTYNSNTNEYHFNFTMHVQSLLNDFVATGKTDANRGLYVIIPTDNPISAGRLIMDTRKGSGIKLKLYYTIQN